MTHPPTSHGPPPPAQLPASPGVAAPQQPQQPRRRMPWIVVTALLVLVGVVLLGLLMRLGKEEPLGESAASSARGACVLIGQVPEHGEWTGDESDDDLRLAITKLASASALGDLAAEQDEDYTAIAEQLRAPIMTQTVVFDIRNEEVLDALEAAREACADEYGGGVLE